MDANFPHQVALGLPTVMTHQATLTTMFILDVWCSVFLLKCVIIIKIIKYIDSWCCWCVLFCKLVVSLCDVCGKMNDMLCRFSITQLPAAGHAGAGVFHKHTHFIDLASESTLPGWSWDSLETLHVLLTPGQPHPHSTMFSLPLVLVYHMTSNTIRMGPIWVPAATCPGPCLNSPGPIPTVHDQIIEVGG